MNAKSFVLFLGLAGLAAAADQPAASIPLQSAGERNQAPDFRLKDAAGKTVKLKDYRGKVVLLDFWATWCTGCKEEIPWFYAFQQKYGKKGFAVVGVSLDDDGWKTLKPFLANTKVGYRMLLGDQTTARDYGVADALPDTFLIDRNGKVAAAYLAQLVNKDSVEANIQALLLKK